MPVDGVAIDPATLPGVLAGPILRRLTRTSVCVWVAVSRPQPITLHVTLNGANEVTTQVTPIQVGSHLWLAAITSSAPGGTFAAGSIYSYRLSSSAWNEPNWADLSLAGANLPAFPGLPNHIEDLVLLHNSCRNWAGGGGDALALASDVIEQRIASGAPNARPYLLVHAGNQIYADDVPTPLTPRIRRLSADLVEINQSDIFDLGSFLGGRQLDSTSFGLTSTTARDHLWTIGEFYAAYLLAWSDVLWPATIPSWNEAKDEVDSRAGLDEPSWNELVSKLSLYRAALPKVRKLLANVPSLMIFDDREISDDWNINYEWLENVYGNTAGRRVVANGLVAYNLFQHWGNVPDRFSTTGTTENAILTTATFPGPNTEAAQAALEQKLGLPGEEPPEPPSVTRDRLAQGAMAYDFMLGAAEGYPATVAFLDERTVREFPDDENASARIALGAIPAMIPQPTTPPLPTIVVAPSALFGSHGFEHILAPAAAIVSDAALFTSYEFWSLWPANHQDVLHRLAQVGPVIVLSGDVNYGAVYKASFTVGGATTRFAQLTCSSAKNADGQTMTLHQLADLSTKLGLERPRSFSVFQNLTQADRDKLNNIPQLPVSLPYDDLADVVLGRVRSAKALTPAVLSKDLAAAYKLPAPDWEYEFSPVDDQAMPTAPAPLNAMNGAPAVWSGWNPDNSFNTVKALRASDLHRIGRVIIGLPNVALVECSGPPLTVNQHAFCPVGESTAPTSSVINRKVVLA